MLSIGKSTSCDNKINSLEHIEALLASPCYSSSRCSGYGVHYLQSDAIFPCVLSQTSISVTAWRPSGTLYPLYSLHPVPLFLYESSLFSFDVDTSFVARCLVSEYHEVFATFDRDHDGRITVADLLNVSHRLGLPTNEQDLGILLGNTDIHGTSTGTHILCRWPCTRSGKNTSCWTDILRRLTIDSVFDHIYRLAIV